MIVMMASVSNATSVIVKTRPAVSDLVRGTAGRAVAGRAGSGGTRPARGRRPAGSRPPPSRRPFHRRLAQRTLAHRERQRVDRGLHHVGVLAPRQQRLAASFDVQHQLAVHQHDQCSGLAARPVPGAGRRPGQCRAERVGGVGGGQDDGSAFGGSRRPKPVHRAGHGELGRAERFDEVPAPAAAGLLERPQHPVDRREPAWHALCRHRAAGDDAVPVEQRVRERRARAGSGRVAVRQQRPPPRPRSAARSAVASSAGRTARASGRRTGRLGARRERRAQRRNRVVGHQTRPDQVPQRGDQCGVVGAADPVGQGAEEQRGTAVECVEHFVVQRRGGGVRFRRRQQQRRRVRRDEPHPAVPARQPAGPGPQHLAGGAQLVEHRRAVVDHAAGQHQLFHRRWRA